MTWRERYPRIERDGESIAICALCGKDATCTGRNFACSSEHLTASNSFSRWSEQMIAYLRGEGPLPVERNINEINMFGEEGGEQEALLKQVG